MAVYRIQNSKSTKIYRLFLGRRAFLRKISSKSVHNFLIDLADKENDKHKQKNRQTDRQTDTGNNITSAEVIMIKVKRHNNEVYTVLGTVEDGMRAVIDDMIALLYAGLVTNGIIISQKPCKHCTLSLHPHFSTLVIEAGC